MSNDTHALPVRPASRPVELVQVDRSNRAVLNNLGQLYRYDLSEALGELPNPDGTFNHGHLDRFLAGVDPGHRAWLILVAGHLGGFALTLRGPDGGTSIADFFVVRALRRAGVGREAAQQLISMAPGRWSVGFQPYDHGARLFWSTVATSLVGHDWESHKGEADEGRPPDTWISFTT